MVDNLKILTFDVEEWFHILNHPSTENELKWNNYESRILMNMDKIFELINRNNLKATFFVVGWIAKKYPLILKKINELGFEIGSHTHYHQLMYNMNKSQVEEDLIKSIDTIEEITQKKVKCFRAPGFSITETNKWIFDILIENGITHDSSIFPANRAHGGLPSFKSSTPCLIDVNGFKLKEFPINTYTIFNNKIIFSGGGYFRILPYSLIKTFTNKSKYVMTYFHPRDFDPNQPVITDLSFFRKFKSYIGLRNCLNKLENWVNDFDFIDLKSADKIIDWDNVPIININ